MPNASSASALGVPGMLVVDMDLSTVTEDRRLTDCRPGLHESIGR